MNWKLIDSVHGQSDSMSMYKVIESSIAFQNSERFPIEFEVIWILCHSDSVCIRSIDPESSHFGLCCFALILNSTLTQFNDN